MATFRKLKTGKWEAQIARKGFRKSSTFDTKAEASEWATKVEAEILGGKKLAVDKTFGDLLEKYSLEVSPKKGGGLVEQKKIAKLLKTDLATVKLKDLTPKHFADYRDSRLNEVSGGTVLRDMATMSAALTVAKKEWGWIDRNPLQDVAKPKKGEARDRRVSDEEIAQIMAVSGYRKNEKPELLKTKTCAAFLFAIETGMRDGELAALTIDRVNLRGKYAHVTSSSSKGRFRRDVPLSEEAMRIIKQMGVEKGLVFGMTSKQITTNFIHIKQACRIDDLTFHDSRHEAVTRLARKIDPLSLSRAVGHKNLNQLTTYYNETATEIAAKL